MALLLAGLSSASVNPKVQLMDYSISEIPAQPGHTVELALHMKSAEWDNCAENVGVQLVVSYPLSIQGSDTLYIDKLCFNDSGAKGTFTFKIPVDNLATSGTYPVSVSTTYEKRFTKLSESNTVNVRVGGSPSFTAAVSSSNPTDIYPGDSAQVTITFVNSGSSSVQSARVSTQSSGIDVKWAGSSQSIGQIAARGSASATFTIEAPKSLKSGSYPLNVHLDYVSENRSQGSSDFTFYVPVKPKAEFSARQSSESLQPGQQRRVNIEIENSGTQAAKKVQVRIRPIFPFSTDGTVRYIESLKPGERKNLTYTITVDKEATAGGQLLSLLVKFEDPQGKEFSETEDFAFDVKMATLQDEIYNYWYVGLIVVIIAAMMLRRKFASKKK